MLAMSRLRLLGVLVIGSALAVLLALVAFSRAAQANHSWGKYHWARTSNPFTLQLADNVSSTWDDYLRTTSSDWSITCELPRLTGVSQACWTRGSSPVQGTRLLALRQLGGSRSATQRMAPTAGSAWLRSGLAAATSWRALPRSTIRISTPRSTTRPRGGKW